MQPLTDQGWKGSDNIHADVELAAGVLRNASNLDFMSSGKVRTRVGYVSILAGATSSGLAFGKLLLSIRSGSLVAYHVETGSSTTLFAVQGSRLGHAVIGEDLFLSDGVSKWRISPALAVSAWPYPAADDPTFDARFLAPFPASSRLCGLQGRMVAAIGNAVVYSEPAMVGALNLARNFFTVPAQIRFLYANDDTLFVGADQLYAVAPLGVEGMRKTVALPIACPDAAPAVDDETGIAYLPTTRGLVVVPHRGAEVSALGSETFAVRAMSSAAVGVLKRDGVTQIVATSVPDSSSMAEHPLVSTDYLRSEAVRKELQNAA